jgi:hypothetical protein
MDISIAPETTKFGKENGGGKIVRTTTEGIGVKFKKPENME